ncbi:MAG: hypothetical protein LKJ75_08420 [Clostridia bacterium]|jgi:hypothetical protein|nr:hypothetical protein [Clostridia bacterium]MCI2015214.1 hypothetical protein [Clostridia bacterium]
MSLLDNKGIPVGLGLALSDNTKAMNVFYSLDDASRNQVIQRSHSARSKEDMAKIVNDLIK